jgi:hypothetical protein
MHPLRAGSEPDADLEQVLCHGHQHDSPDPDGATTGLERPDLAFPEANFSDAAVRTQQESSDGLLESVAQRTHKAWSLSGEIVRV